MNFLSMEVTNEKGRKLFNVRVTIDAKGIKLSHQFLDFIEGTLSK